MIKKLGTKCYFWFLILLCVVLRVVLLDKVPLGLNQDEAYGAYEAFSMLEFGVDSWGYRNPCYFVSWGSGMNVMYANLLKLFFLVFGYYDWVIRFPQALGSILGCYAFYLFLKKGYGEKVGVLGLFLITIMPWNIMEARWGLESAMLPSCLMGAVWFFLKAFDKVKFLYLSLFLFGISLYVYAISWGFLGLFLPVIVGYFWWSNKKEWKNILCGGAILVLMSVPLIWFLAVNVWGWQEYKGEWFSIPKLVYWRGNEWGYDDIKIKLDALYYIFILQSDMVIREVIPEFGLFYRYWWIAFLMGGYVLIRDVVDNGFEKARASVIILCWLVVGWIYALGLYASGTRVNFLFMPMTATMVLGAGLFLKNKWLGGGVVAIYLAVFFLFVKVYFGQYDKVIGSYFSVGLKDALEYAEKEHQKNLLNVVVVDGIASYPKVLWYQKIKQSDFMGSVIWKQFPNAYLEPKWFLYYEFVDEFSNLKIRNNAIYIVEKKHAPFFYMFDKKEFGRFVVAVPKEMRS